LPISAIDAISPAFEHAKQQLLKPFRASQWAKLAFVGFLAGELTSSGCPTNFSGFQRPRTNQQQLLSPAFPHIDPLLLAALIGVLIVLGLLLWIGIIYVNSMMRFVLFDSVIAKRCEIRASWRRRHGAGWRLFVWQLLFGLAYFAAITILVGIPILIALVLGWIREPKAHLAPLVLGGLCLFFLFMAVVVTGLIIHLFTKDFVVPQMALEDIGALEAWRRLLSKMQADKGGFAGYIVMKVVLAIGAAVIFGIAGAIVALILLLPAGGLGVVAVIAARASGVGWNLYTITAAVVVGSILLFVLIYLMSLISVPGIVFFPAYSLYFFAGRYPALQNLLYPAPPVPVAPPILPSSEWPGNPEPIG
jgi:hypothetical protein